MIVNKHTIKVAIESFKLDYQEAYLKLQRYLLKCYMTTEDEEGRAKFKRMIKNNGKRYQRTIEVLEDELDN